MQVTAIYRPAIIAFLLEILLEISFIEEMRTTWGNKEVPLIVLRTFLYSRKCDLVRLTADHWQLCISQFYDITKGIILQKFSQT